jgi:hypothetical protein
VCTVGSERTTTNIESGEQKTKHVLKEKYVFNDTTTETSTNLLKPKLV